MKLSLIVYVTSFILAPLLGVAIYFISIALSLSVSVGNFVVTVILGLLLTFTFDILSFLFIVLT